MLDFALNLSKVEAEYQAIIIGGGPGGLSCALYLSRALVKTLLIEKKVLGGNAILASEIENYPGLDKISGPELIERMVRQVQRYNLPVLYDTVNKIEIGGDKIFVKAGANTIGTRALVIAVGTSYRRLGVLGESEFTGRGVSYCPTCDSMFFKNKVVVLVGGGDSALKESRYLAKIVNKIYLIHRRKEFGAEKIIQEEIKKIENIKPILEKIVISINGKEKVESVMIKDVNSGAVSELKVDGVFINIGNIPATNFVKGLLDLDDQGYIITDCLLKTNIPGIFAVGDVRVSEQRQVATAVGDGAMAAAVVEKYLGRR